MDLTVIQRSLRNVSCPSCKGKNGMNAILRCDLGYDPCVVTVECQHCKEVYEALNSEEREAALEKLAHICPECRSQKTSNLEMLIEVSSRKCHYVPSSCDRCLTDSKKLAKVG